MRTLFRWRGLRPQRDLLLVGLCADPQMTVVETEYVPLSGTIEHDAESAGPAPTEEISAMSPLSYFAKNPSIVHLLVGSGNGNAPWFAACADASTPASLNGPMFIHMNTTDSSTASKPAPMAHPEQPATMRHLTTQRGVATFYCDNPEQSSNIKLSVAGDVAVQAQLILGPLVGSVSTTTAVIVIEVDAAADVAIEATPVRVNEREGQQCATDSRTILHNWLHPTLTDEEQVDLSPGVVRAFASVSGGHPSALHLRGLRAATRYRYEILGVFGKVAGTLQTPVSL